MGQQDSHLGLSSIRQTEWIARKALKKLWEMCGDSISHHGAVEKCLDLKSILRLSDALQVDSKRSFPESGR